MNLSDKIDFFATRRQYLDHLLPVWKKLPKKNKGNFYVSYKLHKYLEAKGIAIENQKSIVSLNNENNTKRLAYCSSHTDLAMARDRYGRAIIYTEHGIGQSFAERHKSYVGGERARTLAILVPGPTQAAKQSYFYPTIPVYQIGVPKLDKHHKKKQAPKNEKIVCVSFHWDCRVFPETRSTFPYYKGALREIADAKEYDVIGHGHPNNQSIFEKFYHSVGIPFVEDFEDVIDTAALYVCDGSSTIYEWLSLDRNVLLLNAPFYRREVEHGMRFWEHADMGVNCNKRSQLHTKILEALARKNDFDDRRKEILPEVYATRDGNASELAVAAIIETIERWK